MAERPSCLKGWPAGPDRASEAGEGPSEERALQGSARSKAAGGPKKRKKKKDHIKTSNLCYANFYKRFLFSACCCGLVPLGRSKQHVILA
ncbi:hypothetical protein SGRA_0481 [Saprospira grandis str. Lewin]|uniref:Uncharacterized protein n=1 Tax=Saprospira grandis (strain Lewin) TaxID=984262 RepID=H6L9P2_SAPGL|nr:hypothetical protein SGRA_0481 [Saprospira grandis str. Lewin]